jgi:ferredoxin--NADP+ reductase
MAGAEVVVPPEDAALDALSAAQLAFGGDRSAQKNVDILTRYSLQPPQGKARRIIFRFLVSPVELIGRNCVEAIRIVKNTLVQSDDGSLRPRPTQAAETLPVGLVFRSIGYKGVALPDVPFDERSGVIPNHSGRVLDPQTGSPAAGEYVVGWIKRGPSGIIGTNKPDSVETVECLLADLKENRLHTPTQPSRAALETLLRARKVDWVTYDEWLALDAEEQERGQSVGRPRLKYSRTDEMLDAVHRLRQKDTNPVGE